jgi:hypothetical protein
MAHNSGLASHTGDIRISDIKFLIWMPYIQKMVESKLFPLNFNKNILCDDVESMWKIDWI